MAFAVTSSSSTAISGSSFCRSSSSSDFKGTFILLFSSLLWKIIRFVVNYVYWCFYLGFSVQQIGSFRLADRHATVNLSQKRCAVKPVNAEPKRNDSMVPMAATIVAPGKSSKIIFFILFFHFKFNDDWKGLIAINYWWINRNIGKSRGGGLRAIGQRTWQRFSTRNHG